MQKLLYFGSAFNPPHIGHMQCMAWFATQPGVTRVLAGPSKVHAFAKDMIDFDIRCDLTQRMLSLSGISAEVSRVEEDLVVGNAPVYTYDVLVELQKRYPNYAIAFGVGPDNRDDFERFYRYNDILTDFEVLVCPTARSVRSTKIREAAREGNLYLISMNTDPSLSNEILKLYK